MVIVYTKMCWRVRFEVRARKKVGEVGGYIGAGEAVKHELPVVK